MASSGTLPGLIGQKKGMVQVFDDNGNALPVTVVSLCKLVVTQIKTPANDGYSAIQIAYLPGKEKHIPKPEQGHFKKNNIGLFRHLKEFRVPAAELANFQVGQEIDPFALAPFAENDRINVQGKSIGKGFQGGTKMWHFSRGPMSHGSKSHRLPGSIGCRTTPGRVLKGKKMARNMGNEMVTTKHLRVVKFLPEQQVVLIHGSVPGVENGWLTLTPSRMVAKRPV